MGSHTTTAISTIATTQALLHFEGCSVRNRHRPRRLAALHVLWMNRKRRPATPLQFVLRKSRVVYELLVPVAERTVRSIAPNLVRDGFDQQAETPFASDQFFLSGFACSDVLHQADEVVHRAVGVAHATRPHEGVDYPTILANEALFQSIAINLCG